MANIQLANLNLGNLPVTITAVGPLDLARWFKAIVNGVHIVYVEVDDRALPTGWQEMARDGNPMLTLPPFPPEYFGRSNYMGLSLAEHATGRRTEWVVKEPLGFFGGNIDFWHGLVVNYTTIRRVKRVANSNSARLFPRIWLVQTPINGIWTNAVMKIAEFPAGLSANSIDRDSASAEVQRLLRECRMHMQAAGGAPSVVPKFLGFVTEPGRGVVGFLSEYIEDAVTLDQVSSAKPGEAKVGERREFKPMLRDAVRKLHNEARVVHSDLHDENVLVKRDRSRLVIIDFELAEDMRVKGDYAIKIQCDYTILN